MVKVSNVHNMKIVSVEDIPLCLKYIDEIKLYYVLSLDTIHSLC
jgi:hypothetical protein